MIPGLGEFLSAHRIESDFPLQTRMTGAAYADVLMSRANVMALSFRMTPMPPAISIIVCLLCGSAQVFQGSFLQMSDRPGPGPAASADATDRLKQFAMAAIDAFADFMQPA